MTSASRAGSGRPLEDLLDPPPLVLGQRARFDEEDAVSHVRLVPLVVRLEAVRPLDDALVSRVPERALHRHHPRLIHLVAHDQPDPGLLHAATLYASRPDTGLVRYRL